MRKQSEEKERDRFEAKQSKQIELHSNVEQHCLNMAKKKLQIGICVWCQLLPKNCHTLKYLSLHCVSANRDKNQAFNLQYNSNGSCDLFGRMVGWLGGVIFDYFSMHTKYLIIIICIRFVKWAILTILLTNSLTQTVAGRSNSTALTMFICYILVVLL